MRVRMLVEITGTRDGSPWPPLGAEIDVPADEAGDLIRGGLAVETSPVVPPVATPVETAATSAPETAAEPAPKARKVAARKKAAPKAKP